MQTSYLYSSYSGLSISTPVVTSQSLSSQIKVIHVFPLSYPHSYQSIPLLSETSGNNSVLLKYATTHATADRGTAHELRPRLFPTFVVNSLPLWSNSAPLRATLHPLRTSLTRIHFWYCPSKAKWPRYKLVDDQVKASTNTLEFLCKNLHLFSRKKEYDDILQEWQLLGH